MATSDSPLNVPNVTLAVTRGPSPALANGQPLTLTGSGFGSIANPRPSALDNQTTYLENGFTAGANTPVSGEAGSLWADSGRVGDTVLDDVITMPGRPLSIKGSGVKGWIHGLIEDSSGPARSQFGFYTTFWMHLNEPFYGDAMNAASGGAATSFKFARFWNGFSGLDHNRVSWLFRNAGPYGTSGQIYGYRDYATDAGYFDSGQLIPAGRFIRFEYELSNVQDDGTGSYTGEVRTWIDGKLVHYGRSSTGLNAFVLDASVLPDDSATYQVWRTAMIGSDPNVSGNLSPTFRTRVAEVYEQPIVARVELSNSAIYDDATTQTRVYQLCASWSDGNIYIPSCYFGTLDMGLPIYAHIKKADGTIINYGRIN